MTLEEGKRGVWAIEEDMLDELPAADVLERGPRRVMSNQVEACRDGGYRWQGTAWAEVVEDFDRRAFIARVTRSWASREDWRGTAWEKPLYAMLYREDGYTVSILFWDRTEFTMYTWTPCVDIPDYRRYQEY